MIFLPLDIEYDFQVPQRSVQGKHKNNPCDFCWYVGRAYRILHKILHNC